MWTVSVAVVIETSDQCFVSTEIKTFPFIVLNSMEPIGLVNGIRIQNAAFCKWNRIEQTI